MVSKRKELEHAHSQLDRSRCKLRGSYRPDAAYNALLESVPLIWSDS